MADKKKWIEVSDDVIESFARCLLPAIREYFESEEGQKEYAKWKSESEERDVEKTY